MLSLWHFEHMFAVAALLWDSASAGSGKTKKGRVNGLIGGSQGVALTHPKKPQPAAQGTDVVSLMDVVRCGSLLAVSVREGAP
jgi:hypothetical protein